MRKSFLLLLFFFGVGAAHAQTVDPCRADIDRSGEVDFRDFLLLTEAYGTSKCRLYWLGEDIRLAFGDTLVVTDTLVVRETLRDTIVVRDTVVVTKTLRDTIVVPEPPQPEPPQPEPPQPEPPQPIDGISFGFCSSGSREILKIYEDSVFRYGDLFKSFPVTEATRIADLNTSGEISAQDYYLYLSLFTFGDDILERFPISVMRPSAHLSRFCGDDCPYNFSHYCGGD